MILQPSLVVPIYLIDQLGITLSPDALMIAVNGRVAELHQELADGDQVNLMPAISGG